MSYTVGQIAELAQVTVRTLHHCDEIGLLSPGGRSSASYRQYDDRDVDRPFRIMFYRELGFALDEGTKEYQQSQKKAASYTKEQWQQIKAATRSTPALPSW